MWDFNALGAVLIGIVLFWAAVAFLVGLTASAIFGG